MTEGTTDVKAIFHHRLNVALDTMAADYNMTRHELIKHTKAFVTQYENNRLREYLMEDPREESQRIVDLLKQCEDK